MNTDAFRNLSYGVYAVSTFDAVNYRPTGCIANSIMQITSSPATVALSLNHNNYTNPCIFKEGKFAVSVFGENTTPNLIGRFGFKSGKDTAKFDGVSYLEKNGLPVLSDACAFLICEVINTVETETHTVFLARVTDANILNKDNPMTYSYYHKVIKGKTAPNAPTYIKEESKKSVYKCSVCGYVYDGKIPFEDLPDSYVCPVCGAKKSKFVLV